MSRYSGGLTADIRVVQRFVEELCRAQTGEQAYAAGMDVVQELFHPQSAYVVLPDGDAKWVRESASRCGPGTPVSDFTIPVLLDGELLGEYALRFQPPRTLTENDLALAHLVAAQTALAFCHIRDRERRDRAEAAKNESVAMAVHELRSPLTAIGGAVVLLQRGRPGDLERAVEMIRRNSKLQVELIEDLLDLANLDAGRTVLPLAPVNLRPVIEQIVEEIAPSASIAGVHIETQLDDPLMINGHPRRLGQIFWNLLLNAVRAAPKGRVSVIGNVEDGFVRVCVTDNGCGIGPERLPYIFERFGRAEKRAETYDGHGLGLAVAKEMVALHGGEISAESGGPGQGARFIVRFPLAS